MARTTVVVFRTLNIFIGAQIIPVLPDKYHRSLSRRSQTHFVSHNRAFLEGEKDRRRNLCEMTQNACCCYSPSFSILPSLSFLHDHYILSPAKKWKLSILSLSVVSTISRLLPTKQVLHEENSQIFFEK